MDWEYEEGVISIVRGRKGCDEEYKSVSEFIWNLEEEEEGAMAHEKLKEGYVFWRTNEREQQQQHQILTLLKEIASSHYWDCIIQFWGVEEGRPSHYHYLSSSHLPFGVCSLNKGSCWYRNLCRDHVYVVNMAGADQEQLMMIGGVGRAYRNKRPESTLDLRLYSTHEYPMRDEAARCGFRTYLALPLFDVRTDQCRGVLEILSSNCVMSTELLTRLNQNQGIQISGFRFTHSARTIGHFSEKQQSEREIRVILELAMATVPRLHLALVWVPCKQCANTNFRCMEIKSSLDSKYQRVISWEDRDYDDDDFDDGTSDYVEACKFHNLQIDDSSFHSNLCDLNISKNPLAHYAQRARMSYSSSISLQSLHKSNHVYIIQFYLVQPKFRQDSYGGDDSVDWLLRIMEMNLKNFKIVSGLSRKSPINREFIDSLQVMNSYNQHLSESNFTFETLASCCLRPSSGNNSVRGGWVFCRPDGGRLCTNSNNSLLIIHIPVEQKIEDFMKKIAVRTRKNHKWIVQFWAPEMMEGRCHLQTWLQPYVVNCLSEGIASFRKQCLKHYYYVDDQAKEEELGPPGRVFRSGHPEITPDLIHYTTKEFPVRNYAVPCFSREYIALPIFDIDEHKHKHKCVGVLEFIGFQYRDLVYIRTELEAAELCSTHIDVHPGFLSNPIVSTNEQTASSIYCRKEALTELHKLLLWNCTDIPQLHMANVWVPNEECVNITDSNMSCMELALCTDNTTSMTPSYKVHWIHVQTRKGILGMVLASESKSCFCQNLSEFSIADQPLSHFEMNERHDACFAICLQSSHTGELVYVLEFFLYQGPTTYEYLRSFLNFLLPMMKHELKSFKMASGKQIGEELVVEVIEFSDANEIGSFESEEADLFPFKFKTVQYSQEKHQHTQEEYSIVDTDSERRERGKRKPRHNLSLGLLQSVSHMTEKDAAQDLGVALSTLKRACRRYGKTDWRDIARDMRPSTSNIQPLDASLHLNVAHTNTEEKVMIKVKYEEDIIKFELCLSLGLAKLVEEVARRINVEMGTIKLKYLDEDGDDILLTNDDDLQLCRKTQITVDKTYIQLFVR